VLVRNGINRLPVNCRQRSMPSVTRYEKQVPGHHVQVDVKFTWTSVLLRYEAEFDFWKKKRGA
jgi:hypothetical protein